MERNGERKRERERERDVASVELQFRAGWSVAAATALPPTLSPFPPPLRLCPSVKRNNYYRKSGAHACGKPRRDPELH